MNKKGFTLLEIIVAMVLFAGVMAGLVGVFVAGKRHVIHSRERMTGGEIEKLFIDPLGMAVRQDTWDNNALNKITTYCDSVAGHPQNPACPSDASQRKVNNIDYTARYDVDTVAGTDLRKVKVQTKWTELPP